LREDLPLPLVCIMAIVFVLHLFIVRIDALVFDEKIYVTQALSIVVEKSFEPQYLPQPLGIGLTALMIRLFGFHPYAWRALPIILGVGSIWVIFLLARAGTKDKSVALLAAGLYGFDVLTFVQSSIAMLDVFFVFFMLAGFYAYWTGRKLLAPALLALSTLCKFPGILGFAVIVAMEYFAFSRPKKILSYCLLYGLVYLNGFIMLQMVLPTAGRVNPILFFPNAAVATVNFGTTAQVFLSKPWDWITYPTPIQYGSTYLGMGNPAIWCLTIPAMAAVAWKFLKTRDTFLLFLLVWFAATYLVPWYPLALFTKRTIIIYYFLPTVGAVTTSISITALSFLRRIREKLISRALLMAYLLIVLYFFASYYPTRLALFLLRVP